MSNHTRFVTVSKEEGSESSEFRVLGRLTSEGLLREGDKLYLTLDTDGNNVTCILRDLEVVYVWSREFGECYLGQTETFPRFLNSRWISQDLPNAVAWAWVDAKAPWANVTGSIRPACAITPEQREYAWLNNLGVIIEISPNGRSALMVYYHDDGFRLAQQKFF